MINKQAKILFIPTSTSGYCAEPQGAPSRTGYYHHLIQASLARSIYTIEGFQLLGEQLAAIARHAYLARQMDAVEQASQMMIALPVSDQLKSLGRYYQALCIWRRGNIDTARQLLWSVLEDATPQYRARALQVIGLTYQQLGELNAALPFYVASGKAAGCDWLTVVESQKMVSVVRSADGDHKRALADLEKLFPLVRAIARYSPATYYDFLNSLAVEFGEVGRIAEAERVCSITLASPFAPAYPEWIETREEIANKRVSATPSVVAIKRAPDANLSPQIEHQRQPSNRLAFCWSAAIKDSFQITLIPNTATAATTGIIRSILDRIRVSVGPRSPPAIPESSFR